MVPVARRQEPQIFLKERVKEELHMEQACMQRSTKRWKFDTSPSRKHRTRERQRQKEMGKRFPSRSLSQRSSERNTKTHSFCGDLQWSASIFV